MAPLAPSWAQPSHPSIQEVRLPSDPSQFTTKSLSKVNLAPYGVFAKLAFPPCSRVEKPTYATVQMGKNQHLNLNSDLIYINHSCDPSLVSLHVFFLLWDCEWRGGDVAPPSQTGRPPFAHNPSPGSVQFLNQGPQTEFWLKSLTPPCPSNRSSICPPCPSSPPAGVSKPAKN